VDYYGWDALSKQIDINCFKSNPSIKSSLKFLRKTPWAREKVEQLYLFTVNASASQNTKKLTEGFVWPDITKGNVDKNT
jgi:uncharacterized protein (DUF2132 family)